MSRNRGRIDRRRLHGGLARSLAAVVAGVSVAGVLGAAAYAARPPTSAEAAAIEQAVRHELARVAAPGISVEIARIVVGTVPLSSGARLARVRAEGTLNGEALDPVDIVLWRRKGPWKVVSGPGTDGVGCDIPAARLPAAKRTAVLSDLGLPVRPC